MREPEAHLQPFGLIAEFDDGERLVEAVRKARAAGFSRLDSYSPYPLEGMPEALEYLHRREAQQLPGPALAGRDDEGQLHAELVELELHHRRYRDGRRPRLLLDQGGIAEDLLDAHQRSRVGGAGYVALSYLLRGVGELVELADSGGRGGDLVHQAPSVWRCRRSRRAKPINGQSWRIASS